MSRKRQVTIHLHSRAGSDGWDTASYRCTNNEFIGLVDEFNKGRGYECWYAVSAGAKVRCGPQYEVATWDGNCWIQHFHAFNPEDSDVKQCLTAKTIRKGGPTFSGENHRILYGTCR